MSGNWADAMPTVEMSTVPVASVAEPSLPRRGVLAKGLPSVESTDTSWMDAMPEVENSKAPSGKGIMANIGSGTGHAVAGLVGMPVDIAAGALSLADKARGATSNIPAPEWFKKAVDAPFGGSESIKSGFGLAGADPRDVVPVTPGEHIAQGVGGGLASMVIPWAGARALPKLAGVPGTIQGAFGAGSAGKGAAMGAAMGGVGAGASNLVPDDYAALKPIADFGGQMATGLALHGGGAAANAIFSPAMRGVRDFTAPMHQAGRERLAQEKVSGALSDPAMVRDTLMEPTPDLVPGSPATPFQITADKGLASLERGVSMDPRYKPQLDQIRQDQNTARIAAIDNQSAGDTEAIGPWFRKQLAQLEETHQASTGSARDTARRELDAAGNPIPAHEAGAIVRQGVMDTRAPEMARTDRSVGQAQSHADATLGALGGDTVGQSAQGHGARIRGAGPAGDAPGTGIEGARAPVKDATARLYDQVDPNGTLALNVSGVGSVARELSNTVNTRMGGALVPAESGVLKAASELRGVELFSDLRDLRSNVTTAMRDISSDPKLGRESRPYARMARLLNSIDDTMVGAVEAQSVKDAAAVKSGAMTPGEAIHTRLREGMQNADDASGTGPGGGGRVAGGPADRTATQGGDEVSGSRGPGNVAGDSPVEAVATDGGQPRPVVTRSRNEAISEIREWETTLDVRLTAAERDHAAQLRMFGADPGDAIQQVKSEISAPTGSAPVREPLQPNFTAQDRDALRTANAAYAQYKDTFRKGAIGDVLASSARTPGGYRVSDSQVPSTIFRPGPMGAEAADSLIKAAGSREEALRILGDYPAFSLRLKADKMGVLSIPDYTKWVADHKAVLDKFPELRSRFETAAKARASLIELQAKRAALDDAFPIRPGMNDASVAEKFIRPGPGGHEAAASMIRETGGSTAIKEAAADYLAFTLRQAEVKTGPNAGTIDKGAYDRWMRQYDSFLSHPAMADVRAKFKTAGDAQATLDKSLADHIAARKAHDSSVARHFLGDDVDPVTAVGTILRSKTNARQQMADLARLTERDPVAREAIQRSIIEYVLRELKSNRSVGGDLDSTYLKAEGLQNFIRSHVSPDGNGALRAIMKPDQLAALENVAKDIRRANRSNEPGIAGSTTILNKLAHGAIERPQSTIGGLAALGVGGEIAGHLVAHGSGAGIPSLIGGMLSKYFRSAGFAKIDDIVAEAVIHPERMAALLADMPTKAGMPSRVQAIKAQVRAAAAASAITALRPKDEDK